MSRNKVGSVLALMVMGCRSEDWAYDGYGMGGGQIELTLPFQSGEYWVLTQGYGSNDDDYRGSHRDYGYTYANDTYALDFTQSGCEAYGKEVTPMAAGTVMEVYEGDSGYGNNVLIDHGDGFVSRYGHMSEILVSEGDELNDNEAIGLVGDSGYVTGTACEDYPGAHLHVSFYYEEAAEKPEPLSGNYELDAWCWYNREGDKDCNGNPGDYEAEEDEESDTDEEESETGEEEDSENDEEGEDPYDDDGDNDIDSDGDLEVVFLDISPEEGTADETEFIWVATVVSPDEEPDVTLYIENPNDSETYDFTMSTESEESPYVFTYRKTLNDENSTYTYWVEAEVDGDSDESGEEDVFVDNGHGDVPEFMSFAMSPSSGSAGETEFEWTASGESEDVPDVYLKIVNPNDATIYSFDMSVDWERGDFVGEYRKTLNDSTIYTYWFVVEDENTSNTGQVLSVEVE